MRVSYNAPTTLTFAVLATVVLILDLITGQSLTSTFFSIGPRLESGNPLQWLRLITHPIGHIDWNHLLVNFTFILLLGPILEEKYGSLSLFFMMLITALVTGILNILFLDTGLMGASGIVFMMILLASFTNFQKGTIPLTFILIVGLYLFREIFSALNDDGISQFAHILGGVCGSMFGFLKPSKR
jgi:membrane associated rhomboid family serine protease